MYQSSSSYLDLLQATASIVADNISETNSRNLTYLKSVWEIAVHKSDATPLRSAFERAEAFVSLTEKEIQTSLRNTLEVTEKLLAQGKKLQTQSYESAKEIADKAMVNVKHVVETAADRIETMTDNADHTIDDAMHATKKKAKVAAE